MRVFAIFLLLALFAAPARAGQGFDMRFEVRLWGLPIGALTVSRRDDDTGHYEAEGSFATTGVVGVLARVGFTMQAQGRVRDSGLEPSQYGEVIDTGERAGEDAVRFAAGDGRLDPLTALVTGLGVRPVDEGCAIDREVFDGTRTHRLILAETARGPDAVVCAGEYRRVAGYTEAQLRRRPGYALEVRYRVLDGMLHVESAKSATTFGTVRALRQATAGQ